MRLRYLLFDLDGTLVDSTADIAASVNAARAALGRSPLSIETVRAAIGDGLEVLLARLFPPEDIPRAAEVYRAHYAAHLLDATRAYDGVEDVLERLQHAGCALGVVTNKPLRYSVAILEGLGLAPRFGAVVGGDGPEGRKPAAGPFRAALRMLGAGGGEADVRGSALAVGDGRNDVLGARAAGIRVCGALYGIGSPDEMRALEPDFTIESVRELPALVERLSLPRAQSPT